MDQVSESEDLFAAAVSLQRQGRFTEAAELYRTLAKTRLTVNLALNLGVTLGEMGDFDEAERWLSLAARNRAGDPGARRLLGNVYFERGRFELAELEFRTALALDPDDAQAKLALGNLFLALGRWPEGWPLMEERVRLHPDVVPAVRVDYPEWQGELLTGKSVLVWLEQGFGDQIQFSRFAADLKARGASRVSVGCRPQLGHLFSTLDAVDQVIPVPVGGSASVGRHDVWTRYFSLPGRLGVTLQNLRSAPYLSAPDDRRERWRGWSAARVGLVWQASSTGFNAGHKGLSPEAARRLLDRGAVCLHPEETGAADFADTAAIIAGLDLVISIDTAVAHLAGAMGKPCWVLLPAVRADWRWLRGRTDSPWYPATRLYRQASAGDWDPIVDAVLRDWAVFEAR